MSISVTRLPSVIYSVVTSGPESVFEIPTVDTTPSLFSTTEVLLKVEVNGVLKTETTDYIRSPSGYVTIIGGVATGGIVKTYRETTDTSLLVTWPSATSLNQSHLKKDSYQWLFLLQEVADKVTNAIQLAVSAAGSMVWDFLNRRGVNCADPTAAQDVATKNYVDTRVSAEAATRAANDTSLDAATLASAKAYTDAIVAGLVSGGAIVATTYQTAVAAGATYIDIPTVAYGTFTKGLVLIGGAVLDIATDCTLSSDGASGTRITPKAFSIPVATNAIVVMFS